MSLFDLLAVRAHASPDALATVDAEGEASYAELLARVERAAGGLLAAGVAAGDRVAALDANTTDLLALYFAAARRGAILCPLNARLAAPEIADVVRDAGARVLVVGEGVEARALDGVEALAAAALRASEPDPSPPAPVADEAPAQLYHTSGTTGRPKGVVLTHRNVRVHAESAAHELALASDDRWGHFAPMFHLADAWACFAVTLAGGAHVLPGSFDAAGALAWIERGGVTLTNLVPTMLNRMSAHADVSARDLSSLRLVLSGGAPITPALVRRVLAAFGCEYAQTYGLTETSPFLCLGLLDDALRALPEDERVERLARTGRPFRGVDVEVVDADGAPVPRDDATVGEIRARGPSVSPGYWRRPDETAAAFRDGWLRTGDLATVDELGWLRIVDRAKDVILTGGETVYSTEVESVLAEHPDVFEAAAFALPDDEWGELVAAAVVPAAGARLDLDALGAFCRERLAGYKQPRAWRVLAELPRTGSGKVAKRRLREA